MTGFSYNEFIANKIKFTVTIRSVNSKYLDININLPMDLQHLEESLTKIIKNEITRGKVDVYFGLDKSVLIPGLNLNENLLNEFLKISKKINKKLGAAREIRLYDVINFNGIVTVKQNSRNISFDRDLEKGFLIGIKNLKKMRLNEGKSIYKNFLIIKEQIKSRLELIQKKLPKIIEDYHEKLKVKVMDLLKETKYDEHRVLMEVALLTEKMDVNEEAERLKNHLVEMKKYIDGKKPCGKLLEFLFQEMLRETNTIGSKVSDIDITKHVIAMKEYIEQMREQARNVE